MSRVDQDAYRPGDVVLFIRDSWLFVHRLLEKMGETAGRRGDALLDADPRVGASDVRGGWCRSSGAGRESAVTAEAPGWRRGVGAVLGQSGRLVRVVGRMRESCLTNCHKPGWSVFLN